MALWAVLAVSVHAFWTKQQGARWYELIALPMAGARLYPTVVYFAYEVIAESGRASLVWVFVINLPWTPAPVLLVARRAAFARSSREKQLRRPFPLELGSTVTDASPSRCTSTILSFFGAAITECTRATSMPPAGAAGAADCRTCAPFCMSSGWERVSRTGTARRCIGMAATTAASERFGKQHGPSRDDGVTRTTVWVSPRLLGRVGRSRQRARA